MSPPDPGSSSPSLSTLEGTPQFLPPPPPHEAGRQPRGRWGVGCRGRGNARGVHFPSGSSGLILWWPEDCSVPSLISGLNMDFLIKPVQGKSPDQGMP